MCEKDFRLQENPRVFFKELMEGIIITAFLDFDGAKIKETISINNNFILYILFFISDYELKLPQKRIIDITEKYAEVSECLEVIKEFLLTENPSFYEKQDKKNISCREKEAYNKYLLKNQTLLYVMVIQIQQWINIYLKKESYKFSKERYLVKMIIKF